MHILLSNDDGIEAQGLRHLREELRRAEPSWRITTVAPDRERSGASHALTLTDPLRVHQVDEDSYSVTGTPTDCVLVAVHGLLAEDRPDVVLSGMNHGPNMGEDVHYSGTVAAAMEGKQLGLPSMALSIAGYDRPLEFDAALHFVREVLPQWIREGWGESVLLNVNIPARRREDVGGVRFCRLGTRQYENVIVRKQDPRGHDYYWVGGAPPTYAEEANTDFVLSAEGHITATPLHVDMTDYRLMAELEPLERLWS